MPRRGAAGHDVEVGAFDAAAFGVELVETGVAFVERRQRPSAPMLSPLRNVGFVGAELVTAASVLAARGRDRHRPVVAACSTYHAYTTLSF